MNKAEVAVAVADLAYWNELADALGWQVLGFTYRADATFSAGDDTANMTIIIDGWARDDILNNLKEKQGRLAKAENRYRRITLRLAELLWTLGWGGRGASKDQWMKNFTSNWRTATEQFESGNVDRYGFYQYAQNKDSEQKG